MAVNGIDILIWIWYNIRYLLTDICWFACLLSNYNDVFSKTMWEAINVDIYVRND